MSEYRKIKFEEQADQVAGVPNAVARTSTLEFGQYRHNSIEVVAEELTEYASGKFRTVMTWHNLDRVAVAELRDLLSEHLARDPDPRQPLNTPTAVGVSPGIVAQTYLVKIVTNIDAVGMCPVLEIYNRNYFKVAVLEIKHYDELRAALEAAGKRQVSTWNDYTGGDDGTNRPGAAEWYQREGEI